MKKLLIMIIGVIAIGLISPYIAGKLIKNKIEQKVTILNKKINRTLHVKDFIKLEYNSGWFSSTAKTTMGNTIINHQITHGPYCFFGLGKIDSKVELSDDVEKKLTTLFDGQAPYSITTKIGYTGAVYFNFSSPPMATEKTVSDNPTVKIAWQGLNLSTKISRNNIESSLEIPKLVVSDDAQGTFIIDGLKSKAKTYKFIDNQLNFILPKQLDAEAEFSINKVTLNLKKSNQINIELNEIKTQAKTISNNYKIDFNMGKIIADTANKDHLLPTDKSAFNIDNITIQSSGFDPLWILKNDLASINWTSKLIFNMKNLVIVQKGINTTLNYHQQRELLDDNSGNFAYSEQYNLNDINIITPTNDLTNLITMLGFNYKVTGIPKQQTAILIKQLVDSIRSTSLSSGQDKKKLMQFSKNLINTTLQHTPTLTTNFILQGNKGQAKFDLNIALTKPDSKKDLQLLKTIPYRTNATLSLSIAETLLDEIAKQTKASEAQLVNLKEKIVNTYPLIYKEGNYILDIKFNNHQFYINGTLDPDFMNKYHLIQ